MRFQEIVEGLLAGRSYSRIEADGRRRIIWLCDEHLLSVDSDQMFIDDGDGPTRDDLQADDWEVYP